MSFITTTCNDNSPYSVAHACYLIAHPYCPRSIPFLLPVNRNLLTFRTARGHFSNEPFGMHHSVRGSLRTFHFGKSGSLAVNSGADDGLYFDSAIITMR